MTDLIDHPWPPILIALLVTGVLGAVFVQTRKSSWLLAALAALAITVAIVCIAWFVPTDRKIITAQMDRAARALEAGDLATLNSLISPNGIVLRGLVQQVLPRAKITTAHIGDLEITFHKATSPPEAIAKFVGRVEGSFAGIQGTEIRPIELTLRKEGEKWLFYSVELKDYRELLGAPLPGKP